jgi:hypothetical protein
MGPGKQQRAIGPNALIRRGKKIQGKKMNQPVVLASNILAISQ